MAIDPRDAIWNETHHLLYNASYTEELETALLALDLAGQRDQGRRGGLVRWSRAHRPRILEKQRLDFSMAFVFIHQRLVRHRLQRTVRDQTDQGACGLGQRLGRPENRHRLAEYPHENQRGIPRRRV